MNATTYENAQTAHDNMAPVDGPDETTDEDRYAALAASWVENGGDVVGARGFDVGEFVGWVVSEMSARGKIKRAAR